MFLALIFAFLEASRVSALKSAEKMASSQAADSLLAEYQPLLWKDYGVLFWESDADGPKNGMQVAARRQQHFLTDSMAAGKESAAGRNYYFLNLIPSEIKVSEFELAVDHDGEPFRRQAALAAARGLSEDAVKKLSEMTQQQKNVPDAKKIADMEKAAGNSLDQLKSSQASEKKSDTRAENPDAKQKKKKDNAHSSDKKKEKGSDSSRKKEKQEESKKEEEEKRKAAEQQKILKDNPIHWMMQMKKKGILALVMPEKEISDKSIDLKDTLNVRKLNQGNFSGAKELTGSEKMLFYLYLGRYYADLTSDEHDGALAYEMEYLYAGKESDEKNLKAVVRQLLVMREGTNYLFLLHDPQKQKEAETMAAAIAAAFGQPALIPALKHGIMLAWAYAESLSDVRILLDGGKVSLVKTAEQWHTSLSDLKGSTGNGRKQKGLTYHQFLQMMLTGRREGILAYRAMDLIEKKEDVRMDCMVSQMKCSYRMEASPVFWQMVLLSDRLPGGFSFQSRELLSYTDTDSGKNQQ